MKRWRSPLFWLHKAWLLAAALLVLFAIVVSATRALLPQLDNYRSDLETYLSAETGLEFSLGQLRGSWERQGPVLELHDTYVAGDEHSLELLGVKKALLRLDLWQTMREGGLRVRQVELSGLDVRLHLPLGHTERAQAEVSQMGGFAATLKNLFFHQLRSFVVRDSEFTFLLDDAVEHRYFVKHLNWFNKGIRHHGVGELYVSQNRNQTASLILDLFSGGGAQSVPSGRAYIEARNLDWLPLLAELEQAPQLSRAQTDLRAWLDFDLASLRQVTLSLSNSEARWRSARGEEVFRLKQGAVRMLKRYDSWLTVAENLNMQTNGRDWQLPYSELLISPQRWSLDADPLPLAGIAPLALLIPQLAEPFKAELAKAQPYGQLQLDTLGWQADQGLQVSGRLTQLGWSATERLPGVSNLSASFSHQQHQGELVLSAEPSVVVGGGQLGESIPLQQLAGTLHWRGKQLQTDDLQIKTDVAAVKLSAQLDLTQAAELRLYGEASLSDAGKAADYFPRQVMPKVVVDYLEGALRSGHAEHAKLLWHGPFRSYPFARNPGIFQAQVPMRDAVFKFDPDWPELRDLAIDLLFENNGLWMNAEQGRIGDVNAHYVSAVIPVFSHTSELAITALVQGSGEAVTQVMQASELSGSVGKTLAEVAVSGPVIGQFTLQIPLYHGGQFVAEGKAKLADNAVRLVSAGIPFTGVSGELTFHNDQIKLDGVNALLAGLPLQFSLEGAQAEQGYQLSADLHGGWRGEALQALGLPWMNDLRGQLDWQGELALTLADEAALDMNFSSSLQGLQSLLPAPLAKRAEERWPAILRVHGALDALQFEVSLPEHLALIAQYAAPDSDGFRGASLALGEQAELAPLSDGDILVDIGTQELDLHAWQQALQPLFETDGPSSLYAESGLALQQVKVRAQRYTYAEHQLGVTAWLAQSTEQGWQVNGQGDDLALSAIITPERVSVDAERILLSRNDNPALAGTSMKSSELSWVGMPALHFICQQCQVLDVNFGKVELNLLPWQDQRPGMQLESMVLTHPAGSLSLSGGWQAPDGVMQTQLTFSSKVSDIGALAKQMRVADPIKQARFASSGELNWSGSVEQFALERLNGRFEWQANNGVITDINDKGSRVLGLLSIETLLRKLTLNFSDLFSEGLYFDRFGGSVAIRDGKASTDNTRLDGTAVAIDIKGSTMLPTNQLNYQVAMSPKVTSSLPVLAAFAVTPVTGLYVLALTKMLEPVVEVITQVNVNITGTIEQPIFEEVGRTRTDVEIEESKLREWAPEAYIEAEPTPVPQTESGAQSDNRDTVPPSTPPEVQPVPPASAPTKDTP